MKSEKKFQIWDFITYLQEKLEKLYIQNTISYIPEQMTKINTRNLELFREKIYFCFLLVQCN